MKKGRIFHRLVTGHPLVLGTLGQNSVELSECHPKEERRTTKYNEVTCVVDHPSLSDVSQVVETRAKGPQTSLPKDPHAR